VRDNSRIAWKIRTLAGRQYGHVTRAQLLGLGLGRGAIDHRIEAGKLIVVHPGVYAVGHQQTTAVALAAAAVLACGPDAVLSHESAAALWGMRDRWPRRPEVTAPRNRRRPGICAHRSRTLSAKDIRRHRGIRVTSPARTVLEIASRLSAPALARTVNDGRLGRHLRVADLAELLERLPQHPGTPRVLPLIRTATGPTRSQFEDAFVAFDERFGLPFPRMNARVAGYEVDALFEAERLIVELDGFEYHRDRRSFERDRERDAATLAAGYGTVRLTWERFTGSPDREAARLHAILRARRGGDGG
jgi:very-short-patch-repair endonuclease